MAVFVQRSKGADIATSKPVAAVDQASEGTAGSAAYPEAAYLGALLGLIILGCAVGALLFARTGPTKLKFTPSAGVGTFALFYILAQVIERIQEPFTPFIKGAEGGSASSVNQRSAQAKLDVANSAAINEPTAVNLQTAANAQRTADQIRANATVLLFGTGSLLAMLGAGYLKAGLLQTIGLSGAPAVVEVLMTGLVVGAGTKPLHDLISNLSSGGSSSSVA
jgi:hypothetical protein